MNSFVLYENPWRTDKDLMEAQRIMPGIQKPFEDLLGALEFRSEDRVARNTTRLAEMIDERHQPTGASSSLEQFAQAALDGLSAQIAILDDCGVIVSVNQAWSRLSDKIAPLNDTIRAGANYLDVCDRVIGPEQEDARLAAEGIRSVIARERELFTLEYPCEFPGGTRWFMLRATPFSGAGCASVVVAHEDITARKDAEIELIQMFSELTSSEARLAEAQRAAQIGSWEYEFETGGITWSEQMFRLFDLPSREGEPSFEEFLARCHPDDVAKWTEAAAEARRSGVPSNFDMRILMHDGSARWMRALVQGGRHWSGQIVRLFGTFMDIHEQTMQEAERRAYAEQLNLKTSALRMVLDSAPIMLYTADANGIMTLSEGAGLEAMGLNPGEVVGRSISEFTVDPQSIENTRRAFAGEAISYEANVNGLWLHTELRPVFAEDGAPAGIVGVSLDVTERIALEQRFRVLFECSSDAHLLLNDNGIIDCNNAAVAMLRCQDKSQVLSLHPAMLSPELQPDGRLSLEKSVEMDALAYAQGFHRFEWTHRKMDGEDFPVEVTLTPVNLGDRSVLLVVWHDLTERIRAEEVVRDSAAQLERQKSELEHANALLADANCMLEKANERLERLAATDGLTGLLNRRAFHDRLAKEIRYAIQQGTSLSLILLDVDRFKNYNDSHGHPAGDAILEYVACVVSRSAGDAYTTARYGGEEFALILPKTDGEAAAAHAEQVRAAIESRSSSELAVTASFGVATLCPWETSCAELIVRADEALYKSKTEGRNRVTLAGN